MHPRLLRKGRKKEKRGRGGNNIRQNLETALLPMACKDTAINRHLLQQAQKGGGEGLQTRTNIISHEPQIQKDNKLKNVKLKNVILGKSRGQLCEDFYPVLPRETGGSQFVPLITATSQSSDKSKDTHMWGGPKPALTQSPVGDCDATPSQQVVRADRAPKPRCVLRSGLNQVLRKMRGMEPENSGNEGALLLRLGL